MLRKLTPMVAFSAAALLLTGCASHAVIDPSFTVPKTGKTAVVAVSVVCKTTRHSTASKVFGLEPFDSSGSLQYDQTNAGFWRNQDGMLDVLCDSKPHRYLEHINAGKYHFDEFNVSNGTADLNIKFSVTPNKVTYIGRIIIDARAVTKDFGDDLVTFAITNHAKSDLAYFRHHFKNIPAKAYRVHLARNMK